MCGGIVVGGNGIFSYTWVDALGNDLGQDNDTAIIWELAHIQ